MTSVPHSSQSSRKFRPVRKLVIAVDGPAAAGKGTLARALAERLALPYLDTGLLYRAVARRVLDAGHDPAAPAEDHAHRIVPQDLQRQDLRTPEVDQAASLVARQPAVRAALLGRQRDFGQALGAVVDGRDIGTVVFPDADMKFFITASTEARAQRRYRQRVGQDCRNAEQLEAETRQIAARDAQDSERANAPLRAAEDALLVETDRLDAGAVLELVCQALHRKGLIVPQD
ncbi:(d)CMP kinase [Oecophyllibacter saccharovorans]|uniref:(d)CMP kinase n=1 Tax=Oecophyllibacter saccharovorans TaxID=2558360 RepID=UPI001F4F1C8D|nr:(d)CMP kinase [Oecophyllibacter saccharovorans]